MSPPWNEATEIAIVGGGMCGVICAGRCADLGIPYTIIERQACYGGVWSNLANANSALQARLELLLKAQILSASSRHAQLAQARNE